MVNKNMLNLICIYFTETHIKFAMKLNIKF